MKPVGTGRPLLAPTHPKPAVALGSLQSAPAPIHPKGPGQGLVIALSQSLVKDLQEKVNV